MSVTGLYRYEPYPRIMYSSKQYKYSLKLDQVDRFWVQQLALTEHFYYDFATP